LQSDKLVVKAGNIFAKTTSISTSWAFDGATDGGIAVGAGYADGRLYAEGSQSASLVLHDSGGTANLRTIALQINGDFAKLYGYNDSGTLRHSWIEMDQSTGDMTLGAGDLTLSSGDLTVNGTDLLVQNASNPKLFVLETGAGGVVVQGTGSGGRVYSNTGQKLLLGANGQNAHATIDTSGNFLLGATSTANNAVFYSTKTFSNASGTDIAAYFSYSQNAATTGELRGVYSRMALTHTSGTVNVVQASRSLVSISGAGGTTTSAYALRLDVTNTEATATVNNAYGLYIGAFTETGTITNGWGVYQAGGSQNNYLAGDLLIGTTSTTSHGEESLHLYGSGGKLLSIQASDSSASKLHFSNSTTGSTSSDGFEIGIAADESGLVYVNESTALRFGTAGTERFRVASNAYALGIGTTDVESWGSNVAAIEFAGSAIQATNTDAISILSNAYFDGAWKYKATGEASRYELDADSEGHVWFTAASGTADNALTWSEKMRLTNDGMLLVGDTANANMTVGLTINQGANDDQILALKSSDVAHGMTSIAETDTFFYAQKLNGANGGVTARAFSESTSALRLVGAGTTADTNKTTTAAGFVEILGEIKSSATVSNIGADDNLVVFRSASSGSNAFIIAGDGDFFYNGADGGAFDVYEDAHLVRAFANATSKETVRTAHDDWVQYNEQTLVDIGVLGAPVSEGGLINGAQLQRVHTGAIWQNYMAISDTKTEVEVLRSELADTKSRLAIAESKLKQLPQA
jgi:hypothetical protein